MKRACLGALLAGLFGCSTSGIEAYDASSVDGAGNDGSGSDATAGDAPPTDGTAGDTGDAGGGGDAADGGCACEPYWCGCGACNPGDISCSVSPPPCDRGCASSCPELAQTTCSCEEGRCIRGGIDASAVGCLKDEDCPQGDCCAFAQGAGHCATSPNTCCINPCP